MIINKSILFEWKHIKSIWRHSFCGNITIFQLYIQNGWILMGWQKKHLGKIWLAQSTDLLITRQKQKCERD